MRAYVEFEISQGAYEISCPDAMCESQGVLSLTEIENLVNSDVLEKHKRYRLNRGKPSLFMYP
jgi:E3 ubiquitin-protein ligase RNF144